MRFTARNQHDGLPGISLSMESRNTTLTEGTTTRDDLFRSILVAGICRAEKHDIGGSFEFQSETQLEIYTVFSLEERSLVRDSFKLN